VHDDPIEGVGPHQLMEFRKILLSQEDFRVAPTTFSPAHVQKNRKLPFLIYPSFPKVVRKSSPQP